MQPSENTGRRSWVKTYPLCPGPCGRTSRKGCVRLILERLLHGENDRARCRGRARSARHGYGVGSCRGAGIASAAPSTASTATTQHTAGEEGQKGEQAKHRPPTTPPRRDANSRRHARVAPPVAYHGTPGRLGYTSAALVGAVVEMVRVAVPALVPVMLTGLVAPKLKVAGTGAIRAGRDSRRQRHAAGEAPKWRHADGRGVPRSCAWGDGDGCAAERKAGTHRRGDCYRVRSVTLL